MERKLKFILTKTGGVFINPEYVVLIEPRPLGGCGIMLAVGGGCEVPSMNPGEAMDALWPPKPTS